MINKDEVTGLIQKLVAFRSPYFEEEAIMKYVKEWFLENGLKAEIHDYHEDKVTGHQGQNIILELDGGQEGPVICLNGHLDTVKLCDGWTRDPYAGETEGDRLYGVGALDMKAGCAATMIALKEFYKKGPLFNGKIIATFVSVEEGPYGMGTNALIEEGYLDGVDLSIVTEPSSGFTEIPFPVVCMGARGGYGLEVEFFGKSAHAALPKEGISAALDAAKFVQELENITYRVDEHLGQGVVCVVAVQSDGGACSVPDRAVVKLFWHIVLGEDEGTIQKDIEETIQRAGILCKYEIRFREAPSPGSRGFMPYVADENHPLVKKFYASIEEVCQDKVETAYFQSIGDFNYLGSRLGAPAIIFGPSGEGFHGSDEYVSLSSVAKTAQVLEEFLNNTLRGK
jgi:succinyl-diaminopimelate desuccinylase